MYAALLELSCFPFDFYKDPRPGLDILNIFYLYLSNTRQDPRQLDFIQTSSAINWDCVCKTVRDTLICLKVLASLERGRLGVDLFYWILPKRHWIKNLEVGRWSRSHPLHSLCVKQMTTLVTGLSPEFCSLKLCLLLNFPCDEASIRK